MTEPDEPRDIGRQERLRTAGTWLRGQRDKHGWSGSDLARRLDIQQVRISAYERGQYEVPSELADKLAAILDLSVIDVRRQLGLWVPDDTDIKELRYRPNPQHITDDALIAELIRRYRQRTDREIIEVFSRRSEVPAALWDRLILSARSDILLGGYTNYFFWTERPDFRRDLIRKAEAGTRIRILVGNPSNEVTQRRENIEQAPLTLTTRIRITLDELTKMSQLPNLEVRLSNLNAEAHVSRSVFKFDREALVCEHIADRLGHGSLTFHLRRTHDDGPFDQYSAHVEYLWDGAGPWQP